MKDGIIKMATASHTVLVGDVSSNARRLVALAEELAFEGCRVIVTPAEGLTGSTIGDMRWQSAMLDAALDGLEYVVSHTTVLDAVLVVGVPLVWQGQLYNCAAVCKGGRVLGVVAQFCPEDFGGHDDSRYFAPAPHEVQTITLWGEEVPFGGLQVFSADNVPNLRIGVEIGGDLWSPRAPHAALAMAGATVLCHLDATEALVGAAGRYTQQVAAISDACKAAYIHCDAWGESTTNMVVGGHEIIAVGGEVVAEAAPFATPHRAIATVDVDCLQFERLRTSFGANDIAKGVTYTAFVYNCLTETPMQWSRFPFVPDDVAALRRTSHETLTIQAHGLAGRMAHIQEEMARGTAKRRDAEAAKAQAEGGDDDAIAAARAAVPDPKPLRLVLGVSGGLDSTMALLVCIEACRILDESPTDILSCVTMPCFGTTVRTKSNAVALCEALQVPCRTVDISDSVRRHLADIGHDMTPDVAFENAQARMRTMVLMDIANQEGGLVVGTGDLSELALGWCTYNGDHMSMYAVNASLPKTLIRRIVEVIASESDDALRTVLCDILDTPISPELLPADSKGQIAQKTEEIIGKYDVNDFILYYTVRWGVRPRKLFRMASATFAPTRMEDEDEDAWVKRSVSFNHELKDTFIRFYQRFCSQQFKRSCSPDGPKLSEVDLAPRGDWRMPSDAFATTWVAEIEAIQLPPIPKD